MPHTPTLATRAVLGFLRLPGRTVQIPGWFPLVVERAHPHLTSDDGPVEVETDGFRMRLDLRDYIQRRIYYRAHERAEVAFVKSFLRPGDVVLDVGAHVGLFTLVSARAVGPRGETHSFEPIPANYASLEQNVGLNGFEHAHLNQAAAGLGSEALALGQTEIQPDRGQTSAMYTKAGGKGAITVPKVDLGDYLEEHLEGKPIRLVKVDVEGMEPEVLSALERRIATAPPDAFLIEVNVERLRLNGHTVADVSGPLECRGYRFFTVGSRGHLRRISKLPDPPSAPVSLRRSVFALGWRTRDWLYNVVALSLAIHGRDAGR